MIRDDLKKTMYEEHVTALEVARRSGVTNATISRFFSGQISPKLDTIERICDVLGYDLKMVKRKRVAILKSTVNGEKVRVTATMNHPDASYGKAVWVDDDGKAYCEVDPVFPSPFYEITEINDV